MSLAARLTDALEKGRIDLGADREEDVDVVVAREEATGKAEEQHAAADRRTVVLEWPRLEVGVTRAETSLMATRRRSCARVAMAACSSCDWGS